MERDDKGSGHLQIGLASRANRRGDAAQHPSVHLLLHRGEVLGCQRGGLGELDLPVLAHHKHPVEHAAMEVHMRIQCTAKALHKAHRAQPPARAAAALTQPRLGAVSLLRGPAKNQEGP